jgi:hypothetical protein
MRNQMILMPECTIHGHEVAYGRATHNLLIVSQRGRKRQSDLGKMLIS